MSEARRAWAKVPATAREQVVDLLRDRAEWISTFKTDYGASNARALRAAIAVLEEAAGTETGGAQ